MITIKVGNAILKWDLPPMFSCSCYPTNVAFALTKQENFVELLWKAVQKRESRLLNMKFGKFRDLFGKTTEFGLLRRSPDVGYLREESPT
jgi:hypothetical protein